MDEKVMTPVYFDDIESAEKSVRDGETWGLVAMDGNFSKNLFERIIEGKHMISFINPVDFLK